MTVGKLIMELLKCNLEIPVEIRDSECGLSEPKLQGWRAHKRIKDQAVECDLSEADESIVIEI